MPCRFRTIKNGYFISKRTFNQIWNFFETKNKFHNFDSFWKKTQHIDYLSLKNNVAFVMLMKRREKKTSVHSDSRYKAKIPQSETGRC